MAKSSRAPWKRKNPNQASGAGSKHLSRRQKATAEARARKAGRRYPNLVDNMRVASEKKRAKRKGIGMKSSSRRHPKETAAEREKDPHGGLTAAGRKRFARTEGAHLRPGVTKKISEMTPTEMKRKGSWAVRFYGRKPLPPLVDQNGQPTRLALSAHAWGEPVPRTLAAARRIAAKGKRLLARYQRARKTAVHRSD